MIVSIRSKVYLSDSADCVENGGEREVLGIRSTIESIASLMHQKKITYSYGKYYWLAVYMNGEISSDQYMESEDITDRFIAEYVKEFKQFSKIQEWEF